MDVLGATLIFTLSGLTEWLLYVAFAALVWEMVSLVRSICLTHGPAAGVPLAAAALGAGPVTAAVAAVYGGMTTAPGEPFRGRAVVLAALRGTFVMLLGALVFVQINRKEWSLAQSVPDCALLAVALAAAVWAFRAYRRTTSPVKARTKGLLLALRLLVVFLLTAWAARPALDYEVTIEVPGIVLVGIDTSTSMLLRDMPADRTLDGVGPGDKAVARIDSVRDALARSRAGFERIAEQAQLHVYTFAGGADSPRTFQPDRRDGFASAFAVPMPTGKITAIGDSASVATDPATIGRKHVAAILLITDGCHNAGTIAPEEFAAQMRRRGVPIYTVGVGSGKVTGATHALHVRDLDAADEIDAFNRLPIKAVVEAMGLPGRQVTVTCRFGDKEVGKKHFDVAEPHFRREVEFEHVPLAVGFHRLTVQATCTGPHSDKLAGKQTAGKLVHVVDRGLRILYVEAKFRWEVKFVTAALGAAGPRIRIDRRILTQPLPMGRDRAGELTENIDDWLTYHAIIFGDVPAERFTDKQLEIIKKLVSEYGKGFCMFGGASSFGAGGWDRTPIADILGPDLSRSKGHIEGEIAVQVTREGLDSEIMRIGKDPAKVADPWQRLGTIGGANTLVVTKQAANVLARSTKGRPLIVTQPYGSGRTLAIAFDTTWQWVLSPRDTADLQKRFWRQVALYLCDPKGNVWIATDRPHYYYGPLRATGSTRQSIRVTAGVEDPQGRPMTAAPVTVTLTGPGIKNKPILLRTDKTMRRTVLTDVTRPGEYILKISATVAGKTLSAEHRFEIIQRDLERMDVLANYELLKRMAAESDGRFCRLGKMGNLLDNVQVSTEPRQETVHRHDKLSERLRWPIIVALIALLCLEWAFRKRKGLV